MILAKITKNKFIRYIFFLLLIGISNVAKSQTIYQGNSFVLIPKATTEAGVVKLASLVTPSQRQLDWQRLETTAFLHFGINTFYDQEWGHGAENPARFNPTRLNTDQWARILKAAGMKMLILTCKHHDGFCLWPSKYTEHSVKNSSWRKGKGDVVKDLSESCRKYGLKFGVYLSPWDRHEPTYGDSPVYNQHFINQLTELLTQYGTVDEVWFDGACGEGPNGKKQMYDWESYYKTIRKLQPKAVIAVMGPDVRWVGTESGYGRETEWSVVPYSAGNVAEIAANSQKNISDNGFTPPGDMMRKDLGSREAISKAKALIWYPSEVDVSIRPGWFWHEKENTQVKSTEKLLDIYFSSVGRNSLLLMNIPPDSTGLIHAADSARLMEWKQALDKTFEHNLLANAVITCSSKPVNAKILTDENDETYWISTAKKPTVFTLKLRQAEKISILKLQENIKKGQQIEGFKLEALINGKWQTVTQGTTVGYKRLLRFDALESNAFRLTITRSRSNPSVSEIGFYQ